MSETNFETISANSLSNPMPSVMSAMPSQDEIENSVETLVRCANIARSVGRDIIVGSNSLQGADRIELPRTDIVTQTAPREFSNKVREAFGSRLRNVKTFNVGYYLTNTEFWGEVLNVDAEAGMFRANVKNSENPDECYLAEFDMEEVPSADRALVRVGALFFWEVGREITNGTEKNVSQILFRRMASIGKRQLLRIEEDARDEAKSIRRAIVET